MRWCCGQARALSVSFQDNQGNEILRFERPLRFLGCCSDCCYPSLTQVNSTIFSIFNPLHKAKLPRYLSKFSIFSPKLLEVFHKDRFLGRVREVPVCCTRKKFEVFDKNDEKIYDISGPCCPVSCGGSVDFQVRYSLV